MMKSLTSDNVVKLIVIKLPFQILHERFLLDRHLRSPFVQQASFFEDLVIRCVRYAFAEFPACIGRVFLSKAVALPFVRFRMLRHGHLRFPISPKEVHHVR